MKHLKSYQEINEELTRKQRMWLHLPYVLPGLLIKKFLGITTLLNYKWSEIKKKTTDYNFDPVIAMSSHEISQMKRDIKKISLKDLPDNKLGLATFLRTWNVYLVEGETHSDSISKDPKRQRPIVYLTKDEIKKGDFFCGERISDRDVYSEFKHNKKDGETNPDDLTQYPIIVMIAKADKAEETIDMSKYIEDICVEIEDDLPVEVKINFDKIGDRLWVNIISSDSANLFFSEELDSRIEELKRTIESYLQGQNYKLKGKLYYYLKGKMWYFGDRGRFSEVRKLGKYDDSRNRDRDYNIMFVSRENGINLSRASHRSTTFLSNSLSKELGRERYEFYIDSNDIRTLIGDRENCSDTYSRPNGKFNSKDGQNIQLQSITIIFK
jgi:hypothetical protein